MISGTKGVSIRAPRAGGDISLRSSVRVRLSFQSAPPARGATGRPVRIGRILGVSIRAPRAGGDPPAEQREGQVPVSIRAPRAGGDVTGAGADDYMGVFQSAPPARGATSGLARRGPA